MVAMKSYPFDRVPQSVVDAIIHAKGFVSVTFVKKDGTVRKIVGRFAGNSQIGKTGAGMAYHPADYDLLPMFDVNVMKMKCDESPTRPIPGSEEQFDAAHNSYRMINLRTILEVKINSEVIYSRQQSTT